MATSECIGFDYKVGVELSTGACKIRFTSGSGEVGRSLNQERPSKFSNSVFSNIKVCPKECKIKYARREHVDVLHVSNTAISDNWTCCRKDWREPDFVALVGDHCYSFRHWNEGVDGPFSSDTVPSKCAAWGENSYLAKIETRTEKTAMEEVRARYWGGKTACVRVGAMNIGSWKWLSDMSLVQEPPSGEDKRFGGNVATCSCWATDTSVPGYRRTYPRLVGTGCEVDWRPYPMQYVCAKAITTTTTSTTSTTGTTTTTTTTTTVRKCIDHDYGGTPFRAEINLDFAEQEQDHFEIALPLPAQYHICVNITVDWGHRLGLGSGRYRKKNPNE